jgi:uncharacterized membrane protein
MWDIQLLKRNGKKAFLRNYVGCVAACALVLLLLNVTMNVIIRYIPNPASDASAITEFMEKYTENGAAYDPVVAMAELSQLMTEFIVAHWLELLIIFCIELIIAFAIRTIVSNALVVGLKRYFLENREHKTSIKQVFYGFGGGRYSSTVWVMFLRTIYIFAWSLLFVIPGIIKSYAYMMVPYILAENPELDNKRVFQMSQDMMHGHKWEAFMLGLSFLGWDILATEPTGLLSYFYVIPYEKATYTEFYAAVKAEAKSKGILQPGELPERLIKEEETNEGRTF